MNTEILSENGILLNLPVMDKKKAIELAGNMLVDLGYVEKEYVAKMFEREDEVETYLGNGIAIPHGTNDSKQFIKHSGIVLLQYAKPIKYGNEQVQLVIGIAGIENEHMEILSKIAIALYEEKNVNKVIHATSKKEILEILNLC